MMFPKGILKFIEIELKEVGWAHRIHLFLKKAGKETESHGHKGVLHCSLWLVAKTPAVMVDVKTAIKAA